MGNITNTKELFFLQCLRSLSFSISRDWIRAANATLTVVCKLAAEREAQSI